MENKETKKKIALYLPSTLYDQARIRAFLSPTRSHFSTFNAYLVSLIENDLKISEGKK